MVFGGVCVVCVHICNLNLLTTTINEINSINPDL